MYRQILFIKTFTINHQLLFKDREIKTLINHKFLIMITAIKNLLHKKYQTIDLNHLARNQMEIQFLLSSLKYMKIKDRFHNIVSIFKHF